MNTEHLKTGRGKVKVCFSDVSAIQMLVIQIPTVIIVKYVVLNVTFFRLDFEEEEEEEIFEDADDESAYFDESFQEQQHQQQHQKQHQEQGSDEEDIIFYQEAEQV